MIKNEQLKLRMQRSCNWYPKIIQYISDGRSKLKKISFKIGVPI